MSSHGIKFLDLRDCPHDDKYDRLAEEVGLLSDEEALVVILSFNPTPYFAEIANSDAFEETSFCFNDYQINPKVCVGSITPAEQSHDASNEPIASGDYSSIFAGLPMAT